MSSNSERGENECRNVTKHNIFNTSARSQATDCLYDLIFQNKTTNCLVKPMLSTMEEFYQYTTMGLHLTTRKTVKIIHQRNQTVDRNNINSSFNYFFYINEFEQVIKKTLNLPTIQNIQKSITSMQSLLEHEKNNLLNHFADLHLHPSFSWTAIVLILCIVITTIIIMTFFSYISYSRNINTSA